MAADLSSLAAVGPIAGFLISRLVVLARRRGGRSPVFVAPDLRRLLWFAVGVFGLLAAFPVWLTLVFYVASRWSAGGVLALALLSGALALAGVLFVSPWMLLHPVARRGRYRLVYYLAQLTPLFLTTGETRGGGLLLSAVALANRGGSAAVEREFLARRLARERRGLGAFGAAFALWHALEARAARDAGDDAGAFELEETARALFGTITYFSPKGVARPVRRVADEYLALDSARRGLWGVLEQMPDPSQGLLRRRSFTPAARAVRAFFRERLLRRVPTTEDARVVARLGSPIVDRLFARGAPRAQVALAEARALATSTYAALVRRQPAGPRASLAMLATFDFLLDPASPGTSLPAEVRDDVDLVARVQDEAATSLAEALSRTLVPLHAMPAFGPVSARVHQRLESALFEQLGRDLKRLDDSRAELGGQADPRRPWLEASRVRAAYRRLQFTLGPAAAARIAQRFAYSYGNLGVDMTVKAPLRRPLAHAIFHCLHQEAVGYENREWTTLQARNMKITAGAQ